MGPKDADGMANIVDPDQTAPLWVYIFCPELSVWKLRFIMVSVQPKYCYNYPSNFNSVILQSSNASKK